MPKKRSEYSQWIMESWRKRFNEVGEYSEKLLGLMFSDAALMELKSVFEDLGDLQSYTNTDGRKMFALDDVAQVIESHKIVHEELLEEYKKD